MFIAAISTWCWKGVILDWVETNAQVMVETAKKFLSQLANTGIKVDPLAARLQD